ncbi:ABC-type amino acid transport substrate-binding protein [Rhodobium orientis]|nr:transporter substrate-binding domain-containing protein [Rhodobium orientis]MBB4304671.1 ABC-type amino acid transport substrate-binding protein [Rhodobium orientis]
MTVSFSRHFGLLAALAMGLAIAFAGTGVRAQDSGDATAVAPEAGKEVRVGYRVSAPFVMRDGEGKLGGMAVQLWEKIAEELGYTVTYAEYPHIPELLKAAETGEIDVAVGGISITEDRAKHVDFTQPWFDAGLRVMVDESGTTSFGDIWTGLADAGYLKSYGWLVLIIILSTIGLTLFDRRFDKNFTKSWREGVAASFYSVMLVVTKGSLPSRSSLFGWMGKIFSAFWLVIGIAVFAYITSSVTSVMTSLAIEGGITGPDDLNGHPIAVFTGSIGEEVMRNEGIDTRGYDDVDAAVEALRANDVDAIVADAAVLEYYKRQNPGHGLDVVGRIFHPDKFGYALPYKDSSLIFPVTVTLLKLQEDGFVDQLEKQYFGDER